MTSVRIEKQDSQQPTNDTKKAPSGRPRGFTVSFTMESGTTPSNNSSTKKTWEKITPASNNKLPPDEIKQMSLRKDVRDEKHKLNPPVTTLQRDNYDDENHKTSYGKLFSVSDSKMTATPHRTTPLVNLVNELNRHFQYYTFRIIAGVIVTDLKGSVFQHEFCSYSFLDLTRAAFNNQRYKWFYVLPQRHSSMEGFLPSLFSLVHGVDVVTDYSFERPNSEKMDLTATITQAASKVTPLLCLLPHSAPSADYCKRQSNDDDNNRENRKEFYKDHKIIEEKKKTKTHEKPQYVLNAHKRFQYVLNFFSSQSCFHSDPNELLVVSHMALRASPAHIGNKYFLRGCLNYMRIAYTRLTETDLANRIEKIRDELVNATTEPLVFLLMLKCAYHATTIIKDYHHNDKTVLDHSNHDIYINSIIHLCKKFSPHDHSCFVDLSNFLENISKKNYGEAFQLALDMLKEHIQPESFLGSFTNVQTKLLQLCAFASKLAGHDELTCFVEKMLYSNYVRASHFFTAFSEKKTASSHSQLTAQQHEFLESLNAYVCEGKFAKSLGYRNRRL